MKHEAVISEVSFKGGHELDSFRFVIPSESSFEPKMFGAIYILYIITLKHTLYCFMDTYGRKRKVKWAIKRSLQSLSERW